MGLFSLLRKNKQEKSASGEGEFHSRAAEESKAVRSRGKRKQGNQAAEPVDPILPEKKRARRRLVGALALVLAVVIGLPMILDSEPKPLADDIAIQIPSKDKPVTLSNNAPSARSASKVAASASLDQKEEVVETPSAAHSDATPAATVPAATATAPTTAPGTKAIAIKEKEPHKPSEIAQSVTAEKTKTTPAPAPKAETKSEQVSVAKMQPKPAVPSADSSLDDAARAKAILEGKSDTKATSAAASMDKKSGKYVVQVAALASKEKINELQTKLKDAGIHSYTQKVGTDSGDRTRIRVGPFANKEEADKMRIKLNKLGLNGTVVPPSN
jgi:DedD protein